MEDLKKQVDYWKAEAEQYKKAYNDLIEFGEISRDKYKEIIHRGAIIALNELRDELKKREIVVDKSKTNPFILSTFDFSEVLKTIQVIDVYRAIDIVEEKANALIRGN